MFKKKNKEQEPFTPQDLESMRTTGWFNHKGLRREADQISKEKLRRKRARILMIIIIAIIIILWLLSCLTTQYGDLVVTMDDELATKGLLLSETKDFADPQIILSGERAEEVYHYTYDWFEAQGVLKDLDNIDGTHNGKNYFAYTFYIQNNGIEAFDYNATLEVTGVSKSCDEAARIMVYKNGEPTIYAKPKLGTKDKPEKIAGANSEDAVLFFDNDTVYTELRTDFEVGKIDKYSVIIWFEGEDSECINDIMGGHMRLAMNFEAAELKVSNK